MTGIANIWYVTWLWWDHDYIFFQFNSISIKFLIYNMADSKCVINFVYNHPFISFKCVFLKKITLVLITKVSIESELQCRN